MDFWKVMILISLISSIWSVIGVCHNSDTLTVIINDLKLHSKKIDDLKERIEENDNERQGE